MEEIRGDRPTGNHADWQKHVERGHEDTRQLFQQVSRITQYMAYDLIDKLQWWEKETLKLPDADVEKRLKHVSQCLTRLQDAYVRFSETDL